MPDRVLIYVLNQKFVEKDEDIPEQAQQVVYYSLAIGHHVGVVDCLKAAIECSSEEYLNWINCLPNDGEAHKKLARLMKFGEITVDLTHVALLGKAFMAVRNEMTEPYREWTETLLRLLQAIPQEPAMYLMIKLVR